MPLHKVSVQIHTFKNESILVFKGYFILFLVSKMELEIGYFFSKCICFKERN